MSVALAMIPILPGGKANAQSSAPFNYIVQFIATVDQGNQKLIAGALLEQDHAAVIVVSPLLQARAQMHAALDQVALEDRLAPFGLSIAQVVQVGPDGDLGTQKLLEILPPGFPKYLDSGDPTVDAAVHEAAKAAWKMANADLRLGRDGLKAQATPVDHE